MWHYLIAIYLSGLWASGFWLAMLFLHEQYILRKPLDWLSGSAYWLLVVGWPLLLPLVAVATVAGLVRDLRYGRQT